MPDYSKHTYQQTKDQLTKNGTEIGSFNQNTFREKLAFPVIATIGDESLASGYCNGVLLDWVRRILLSGTDCSPECRAMIRVHLKALSRTYRNEATA